MLAIDVDGTLLDHHGELRPGVVEAIEAASSRGIRTLVCTGRRYRRAREIVEHFGLHVPLICKSGALVKDPAAHHTLWRADIPADHIADLLAHFQTGGHIPISFIDNPLDAHDFHVAAFPSGAPLLDDYVGINQAHAAIDPHWTTRASQGWIEQFHVCIVGTRMEMRAAARCVELTFPGRFRTFVQRARRYEGWMCEVLRADASKWSALRHVAEDWGVPPHEICAIGDDHNDRPMIASAGLGVAMEHAPAEVREVAAAIIPSDPTDALARFINNLRCDTEPPRR